MTGPLDYCETRAAPAGSDFALTREFAPADQRPALTALYALYAELMNIAYQVSEPDAARAKLAWWHDSLVQALEGTNQHPVIQALKQNAPALLKDPALNHLIAGALHNIDPPPPTDAEELLEFARLTGGARARLEARLASRNQAVTDAAEQLGSADQLLNCLRLLPRDLDGGRCFLPMNDLAGCGLSRADLGTESASKARAELIHKQRERVESRLAAGRAALLESGPAAARHLLVTAALDRAWCRLVARQPARLFNDPPRLSPLTRLVTAWRAAGRSRRQMT